MARVRPSESPKPTVALNNSEKSSGDSSPNRAVLTDARLFVGTSGWAYPTWKPGFYPAGLSAKNFLAHYSSRLNSVEVNYTFRQLPTASTLTNWLAATPTDFRFSFKAPQRITHFQRLRDSGPQTTEFVASLEPVRQAGKLGLLLFQLPPNFKLDLERLRDFLQLPSISEPGATPVAFDFRHSGWFTDSVYTALADANAALCVADHGAGADDLRTPEVHPARTHVSLRLRRSGGYRPAELARFAEQAETLATNRDVYIYLRHEDEPTGPLNATALLQKAARR